MYRRLLCFLLLTGVAQAAFVPVDSHERVLGRPYQYLYEPNGRVVALYQGVNPKWKVLSVVVKAQPVLGGTLSADCVLFSYVKVGGRDVLQTDRYSSQEMLPSHPLFARVYNALSDSDPLARSQALMFLCREAKGKLITKQQPLEGMVALPSVPVDVKVVSGKAKAFPRR